MQFFKSTFPWVSFLLILSSSCSTSPKGPEGSEEFNGNRGNFETLVIVSTNDVHGQLAPQSLKSREPEGQPRIDYQAGGLTIFASYLKVLRQQFGERLVWLDAGDHLMGTIESKAEEGAPVVRFFNSLGLSAAAIGNHEFDFSLDALKQRTTEAKYPYVVANIVEKKSGTRTVFPNAYPRVLLQAGNLKVGVVGLTTLETPRTTFPAYVRSLDFTNLREAALREAKALREEGADVVILNGHLPIFCGLGSANPALSFRKATDPLGECDPKSEMVQLLQALPPGTFDAAVSGHSHQVVHHWVAGTPVIQGGASARYINVIYLAYDKTQKRVAADRTRIEGPVPICPAVFQNQNDCNGDRPAPRNGRGPLVPYPFHGVEIKADAETVQLFKPTFEKAELIKQEVIGQVARPMDHERFKESSLGNFIADAVRASAKSDFALVNNGGIRAPFEPGPLTFAQVFRTLPFDNAVVTMHVSGAELKTILRVAESGSRGFAPVSGLQLRVLSMAATPKADDLNADGKIEPWEIKRLLDVRTSSGDSIRDEKMYTLATLDFLVTGGDDLKWAMSRVPADRVVMEPGIPVRDAVIQYIRAHGGPLNPAERPTLEPQKPRLKLETPSDKKTKKRGKKRRK